MFSLVSGVYNAYLAAPQLNILMVGAEGAGKSAVLERLKVTQVRSKKPNVAAATPMPVAPRHVFLDPSTLTKATAAQEESATASEAPSPAKVQPHDNNSKRRSWVCPKVGYNENRQQEADQDEEYMEMLPNSSNSVASSTNTPTETYRESTSMESVELEQQQQRSSSSNATTSSSPPTPPMQLHTTEYDMKPKSKMLPLPKIRPTIGMNLAKTSLCGAQCHVWDLGGRLHDLWERYYEDCDAVIFVFKIQKANSSCNNTDDEDDEDRRPVVTPEQQLQMLEQVRNAIADDVPFLVLGHIWDLPLETSTLTVQQDVRYSTADLLPHYHNPFQAAYFGHAPTGWGIRAALEWLVPLAARQQRVRERPQVIEKY